jgi:hypothetical protein
MKPKIPPMIISTSKLNTPVREKEKKKGSLVRTIRLPGASQLQASAHNFTSPVHSHSSHHTSHHSSSSSSRSHHHKTPSSTHKKKKKKRKRYTSDSDDDNDSDYDPYGWLFWNSQTDVIKSGANKSIVMVLWNICRSILHNVKTW